MRVGSLPKAVKLQIKLTVLILLFGIFLVIVYKSSGHIGFLISGSVLMMISPFISSFLVMKFLENTKQ